MVGKSGKAMQDAVHRKATAIWEVTQKFEESHAEFAASLLNSEDALAEPKARSL
ncbi:MAG TPA: hypothetical protein VFA67_07985 [Candidatus Sulfotelmatobacter sp.]|nr:hypothetical protein [Candidatus Sulfotelmatobacter sp.]